jgi:hypothetical protein
MRLRAGQKHAVIQRVQKTLFAKPSSPIDELAMHDRYLSRRPAERYEPELYPKSKRFGKRHPPRGTYIVC